MAAQKLLDRMRERLRMERYSLRTEGRAGPGSTCQYPPLRMLSGSPAILPACLEGLPG